MPNANSSVIAEHTTCFPVFFVRPAHWNLVMGMSAQIDWMDIAIRLGLTLLGCLIIGFDRSEHGKVASLRTTVLVGLAASLAMIQVNLLLSTADLVE